MSEESDGQLIRSVERLEAINAIRQLKIRYCRFCDDGWKADAIAELFTADGVWEAGAGYGRHVGRQAIANYIGTLASTTTFSIHALRNDEIDVQGDMASGRWRTIVPVTVVTEGRPEPFLLFNDYQDDFRRSGNRWLFSHVRASVYGVASMKRGWL
ncbi:MAG: nuclear transport factor 2 family protein [Dehalococcoidia bacterium]